MNKSRFVLTALAVAFALGTAPASAQDTAFGALLSGKAQLPEPTDSKATGDLKLFAAADGKSIRYTLTVDGLSNAAAADMHLGGAMANGPLVAKLFPTGGAAAKKGPYSGVLAEGTIDAGDLTGPMAGGTVGELLEQIREGNAYVNVHTNDGVEPANSGPGDYRLGEIRGQIEAVKK